MQAEKSQDGMGQGGRREEGQGDAQLGSSADHFSSAAGGKLRACWNSECA